LLACLIQEIGLAEFDNIRSVPADTSEARVRMSSCPDFAWGHGTSASSVWPLDKF